jgi:hypothetical protein
MLVFVMTAILPSQSPLHAWQVDKDFPDPHGASSKTMTSLLLRAQRRLIRLGICRQLRSQAPLRAKCPRVTGSGRHVFVPVSSLKWT